MRLKELREERGFTQSEVAKAIGGTQSNLAKWEKNIVQPSADCIIKLSDFFGVTTDYLLERTDDLGAPLPSATSQQYSAEEQKLIQDYRGLSQPLKEMLQSLIKTWQGEVTETTQRRKNK